MTGILFMKWDKNQKQPNKDPQSVDRNQLAMYTCSKLLFHSVITRPVTTETCTDDEHVIEVEDE